MFADVSIDLAGNIHGYRKGLISRYGEAAVKQLEDMAELRKATKWDRFTLEQIIKTYKL